MLADRLLATMFSLTVVHFLMDKVVANNIDLINDLTGALRQVRSLL